MNKDRDNRIDATKNGNEAFPVSNGVNKAASQPNQASQQCRLADSIINRIEQDEIAPTPRWQFLFHEYSIWGLWVASVVIGAVAVSVMIFVTLHTGYAFYEATHDSAWDFFLDVLPFVWALVLIAMVTLAYYNIRHTRKGYRYPLWQLVFSSLLLSLIGGGALHTAGLGYVLDKQLSENMPMVRTLTGAENKMWQAPEKGRMVGHFSGYAEGTHTEALFTAVDGAEWVIDVRELMPEDINLLVSGEKVRLLGMTASGTEAFFYGCAVIPWMLEKPMPVSELRGERDMFMERLGHHAGLGTGDGREQPRPPRAVLPVDISARAATSTKMYCPKMPLLNKVRPQLPL